MHGILPAALAAERATAGSCPLQMPPVPGEEPRSLRINVIFFQNWRGSSQQLSEGRGRLIRLATALDKFSEILQVAAAAVDSPVMR